MIVKEEAIEKIETQRNLVCSRLDTMHAPKAAHEFLEWERPSIFPRRDDLAVQNKGSTLDLLARDVGDFRDALSHFGKPPAPDTHQLSMFVNLNSRSVVLELERGFSRVRPKDFIEILGKLGKHGEERHKKLDTDLLQAR